MNIDRFKIKKLLRSLTSVFTQRRDMSMIKPESILWNNKPLKEHSVLLWDLENIPFNRLEDIKKVVKYTPDELYIVTKQALGEKLLKKIQNQHFKVLDSHKTISDSKIISIMKLHRDRENMILISSDSDFAKEANSYLKKHKLHWIVTDYNKKAVVMHVNIGSSNLTISTLENKKIEQVVSQKQYVKSRHKQAKKIAKLKPDDNKIFLYANYYQAKVRRAIKKIHQLYIRSLYRLKQFSSTKSETTSIEVKSDNPTDGRRDIYRRNYKGKRVRAGKLQLSSSGPKVLSLYKKLSQKYEMPIFPRHIHFDEFREVENFIHFNSKKQEYYLNYFKRT